MSDELSVMFRGAAREEAAAAKREFPLSPAVLDRFVGHVRRRRATRTAMLAVGSAAVVGAAILGLAQVWHFGPVAPGVTPSPSSSLSPSLSPSPSAIPSVSSSPSIEPSPSPTTTAPRPTETTPPPPPPVVVPGQVTVISGHTGGGSGEAVVDWGTIADATGYRMYRSESPDGPFAPSASVDVATGNTTIEIGVPYEYINIWPPSAGSFEYVEASVGGRAYFRVAAFNAAGEGPRSPVVCAAPPGATETC